jgi:hypothetical protein
MNASASSIGSVQSTRGIAFGFRPPSASSSRTLLASSSG